MDSETFLNRYLDLKQRIRWKKKGVENVRDILAEAYLPSSDPRFSPEASASYSRISDQLSAREEDVRQDELLLASMGDAILRQSDLLTPEQLSVITLRYIQGAKWKKIPPALHVSRATAFRWHREALDRLSFPDDPPAPAGTPGESSSEVSGESPAGY